MIQFDMNFCVEIILDKNDIQVLFLDSIIDRLHI